MSHIRKISFVSPFYRILSSMTKVSLQIVIIPVLLFSQDYQEWIPVGNADFSETTANQTKLALDNNDEPYVVFTDNLNTNIAVMKYNSSTDEWENFGNTGFTTGNTQIFSFELVGSFMS